MKKALIAIVVLVLVIGAGVYLSSFRSADVPVKIPPPQMFSIFYTCDIRGHIEPCGCASGMAGGISRRQTYLIENASQDFLLVDAGDVTAGPREWEILELEYILKGYETMGYHAVNVGHREISLSFESLSEIKQQYDRFVSANVLGPDGKCVFEPYLITTLPNGYRCGIIGVADDNLSADVIGKGLNLAPAADALAKYMPELKKNADFIVVLAFMDEAGMKALAGQFFEIDVIVGGKVQQASGEPIRANQSVIVFNTDKGKTVGRLDVLHNTEGTANYRNDFALLAESMKIDTQIGLLIEEYKNRLKELDFQPHKDDEEGLSSISAARSKSADRYAGPQNCKACHEKAYGIWAKSKHAEAFHTLEEKGHQYNPRCLQCHTVGYMASDGYINQKLTPKLTDVSCEACHGRGDYHVKKQNGEELAVKRVIMKTPNCKTCHDEDNSPHFDRDSYWEKIAHGVE